MPRARKLSIPERTVQVIIHRVENVMNHSSPSQPAAQPAFLGRTKGAGDRRDGLHRLEPGPAAAEPPARWSRFRAAITTCGSRTRCGRMLQDHRPDVVFHLAGLIGGIGANRARPADFCYENLLMGTTVLHESWRAGVRKYITLIGGCSYPAHAPSPIKETELFNGLPQAESAPYSLAKAMSVIQAQSYRRQHRFRCRCPGAGQSLRSLRQF